MKTRIVSILLLGLLAAGSSWWLWLLQDKPSEGALLGPPRSDYQLLGFEMVSLDKQGHEAFSASGPQLSRHPTAATLTVLSPHFTFPDAQGERWQARSKHAWISADGDELRLLSEVVVDNVPTGKRQASIETARLDVFPQSSTLRSDDAVTVRDAASILRGVGLRADLNTRRFQLLSEVRARYVPETTPPDSALP